MSAYSLQGERDTESMELSSHLLATVGIEQDPAKLDDFGRILCNIHPMFIAGGSHMDDNIAVKVGLLPLGRSHLSCWYVLVLVRLFGIPPVVILQSRAHGNCCTVVNVRLNRSIPMFKESSAGSPKCCVRGNR